MRESKQIEQLYYDRLRQMTGEERIKQAFELNRFAWKIVEAGIRNQFPNISEKELKEKLNAQTRKIIDQEYKKAETIIKENLNVAEEIVKLLLKKEELDYDEIAEVFLKHGLKPYYDK